MSRGGARRNGTPQGGAHGTGGQRNGAPRNGANRNGANLNGTHRNGMSPWERWCVHLGNLLVGGTGLVYAVMLYFLEPAEPFSVVNHPWQPVVQHLHIWTAPLLVFGAGLIWRQHIWKHWKQGVEVRRRSGLSLLLTLAPMVVSGYLIQTSVNPTWRTVWVVVHLTASAIWLAGYLGHFVPALAGRRQRDRRERARRDRSRTAGTPTDRAAPREASHG